MLEFYVFQFNEYIISEVKMKCSLFSLVSSLVECNCQDTFEHAHVRVSTMPASAVMFSVATATQHPHRKPSLQIH